MVFSSVWRFPAAGLSGEAKVLADSGDEAGATQVRISTEDLRLRESWTAGPCLGRLSQMDHRLPASPDADRHVVARGGVAGGGRSFEWSEAVSVMRPTHPESTPVQEEFHYQALKCASLLALRVPAFCAPPQEH